jgi:hypothetical protein
MTLGELTLIYLACGAATLPLSIVALRFIVSLSAPNGEAREIDRLFDRAIDVSVFLWIVGGLVFYFWAAHIERRKPCGEQRTNQLTADCRRQLGAFNIRGDAEDRIAQVVARLVSRTRSNPRHEPA